MTKTEFLYEVVETLKINGYHGDALVNENNCFIRFDENNIVKCKIRENFTSNTQGVHKPVVYYTFILLNGIKYDVKDLEEISFADETGIDNILNYIKIFLKK